MARPGCKRFQGGVTLKLRASVLETLEVIKARHSDGQCSLNSDESAMSLIELLSCERRSSARSLSCTNRLCALGAIWASVDRMRHADSSTGQKLRSTSVLDQRRKESRLAAKPTLNCFSMSEACSDSIFTNLV